MEDLQHEVRYLRAQVAALRQENYELRLYIDRELHDDSASDISDTPPSTAFYELSNELLLMIVEASAHGSWPISTETWRLVHPRFSYLEAIMKSLFRQVILMPQTAFSALDLQALQALAPYVNGVKFMHAHVRLPSRDSKTSNARECTSAHNDRIYAENSDLLRPYRMHVESGAQQGFFVKALTALPNIHSVTISCDDDESSDSLAFPRDDDLFLLAVECLHRAGTRITELSTEHFESAAVDSKALCTSQWWQGWDLSTLTSLRIEAYDSSEVVIPDARPELEPILSKCAPSLTQLRMMCCGTLFEQPLNLCMPRLRRVILDDVHLDVRNFAAWLSSSPQLQEIEIEESVSRAWCDVGFISLKPLFDGIRNHPSKMLVKFRPIYVWLYETCVNPPEFHLSYHTGRPKEEALFTPTKEDEMNLKCRAVIDYISKEAEWTLPYDGR